MAPKISGDKYEPIKLDTTILKIEVKTNGDLITKELDLIPFHPNMSDIKDLSNNNYILFPSFVKITMEYLKNAGVGQDYKKVFTNLDKYIDLIKFVTNPKKEIDEDFTLLVDQTQYKNYAMSFVQDFTTDITSDFRSVQKYEPLTDEEIITNNIGIIKSIFLPLKGRFFVLGHEYIINESKYLPPFVPSSSINEKLTERKRVPLSYTIKVELQLLDVALNPGMGDYSRLSCEQKKISLNKDVREIFGESFGYKEEVKVVIPTSIPTTTSKRGFGKLQLEWEERNKYVKAALTERERQEQESKWTPLQKKMAQLDKYQEDFNKIPPLWIKEREGLNMKYTEFENTIKKYQQEIIDIKSVNKDYDADKKEPSFVYDLIQAVEAKAVNAIDQIYTGDQNDQSYMDFKEAVLESLMKNTNIFGKDSKGKYDKSFIEKLKEQERIMIDNKYVKPFIEEMEERKKDVDALIEENDKLKTEINDLRASGDDYTVKSKDQERAKLQANLLKKQTDYKLLEDKYGKNGIKLVEKWEASSGRMASLKENIDSEKNIGEQKILNDSVTSELNSKLDEIKKLKKMLYKAYYFAGQYAEISKTEGEQYSKKPGERPIETVSAIKTNIENLETEYLDIAKKLGSFNQLQSYITLLNDDVERIKSLKKDKEIEKSKKETELKSKINQLEKVSKIHSSNQSVIKNFEKDKEALTSQLLADKKGKPLDEDKKKDIEKKIKDIEESIDKNKKSEDEGGTEDTLREEQAKLQGKIKPLIKKIDLLKAYEKIYNEKINSLRKMNPNVKLDDKLIDTIKAEFSNYKETYVKEFDKIDSDKNYLFDPNLFKSISGGGLKLNKKIYSKKKYNKRKYNKITKRLRDRAGKKDNKNKSLRKRRWHGRKKRYTKRYI